jgi:hypothetical protein
MRWIVAGGLVALALGSGCACRRPCSVVPLAQPAPISTTTEPYVFYNDLHDQVHIAGGRRENYYDQDARLYDVRDLDLLRGAVEVVLLKLPELAREQGATHADLGGGALRVVGPPRAQGFVREVLAMLRASPGPRPPAPD